MVHLHVHSAFSLLDGAASVEALVRQAALFGYPAIALTDHQSVGGVVELHRAARRHGIRPIAGAEVTIGGGAHLTLLATGPKGYAAICRALEEANLQTPRGSGEVRLEPFRAEQGVIALSGCRRGPLSRELLARRPEAAERALMELREIFDGRLYIEVQRAGMPGETALNEALMELSARHCIPAVGTVGVHHLRREDFWIHDILTCVRLGVRVEAIHPERPLNGERYLLSPQEMAERFADHPELLDRSDEIAALCAPALESGLRLYPSFALPHGETAEGRLRALVQEGAERRYGQVTEDVRARLTHELTTIEDLGFADYFLLVWDAVRHARERGIRVAGRGSAADSAVAYCLALTEVDPIARGLPFERFLSRERAERPDIDLDFDHRARDDVAAYLVQRYGARHVAGIATYQTFQARSAVRDLGRALGFPEAEVQKVQRRLPHVAADAIAEHWDRFPELRASPVGKERLELLLRACAAVAGLPRHLGTHLGGLVVSRSPLSDVAPRQLSAKGVGIVPFDKVDIEEIGLLKFDLLSLRTLGALSDAYETAPELDNAEALSDPAAYDLIASGRTIGLFQLESPAQRALQGRLAARSFEDVVHAVAIIRPGPIKGNMVEPYLRRRQGLEPVQYLHPKLKPILEKTFGVVLFQEQVLQIATEIAGFTPGEADALRRVMTHARSQREMAEIGERFMQRAEAQGLSAELAQEVFRMLEGYASYGFPEAHAAAFAATALRTAQLSARRPEALFAALLSQQPMGYYPPHILVAEAMRRGVRFAPLDVARSDEIYRVEADGRVRVGFIAVHGLRKAERAKLLAVRAERPFTSAGDFFRRSGMRRDTLLLLIDAGALDRFGRNRRRLLWQAGQAEGGLFAAQPPDFPDFPPWQRFWRQEEVLGLRGPAFLMQQLRPRLRGQGFATVGQALRGARGQRLSVAGVLFRPHRPPTRSGRVVAFFMLEDETGLLDAIAFTDVYERDGDLLFGNRHPVLAVQGVLDRRGRTPSLRAGRIFVPDLPECVQ